MWAEKGPGGPGEHGAPPSFEAMDANKDGSVTLAEFTAAQEKQIEKRFQKLDANGDGKLTKEELDSGRDRMKKDWQGKHDEGHGDKPAPATPAP